MQKLESYIFAVNILPPFQNREMNADLSGNVSILRVKTLAIRVCPLEVGLVRPKAVIISDMRINLLRYLSKFTMRATFF